MGWLCDKILRDRELGQPSHPDHPGPSGAPTEAPVQAALSGPVKLGQLVTQVVECRQDSRKSSGWTCSPCSS